MSFLCNLQITSLGRKRWAQGPTVITITVSRGVWDGGLTQPHQKRNKHKMNIKHYLHSFDSFFDLNLC